jgi:multidrug efflux system membrane fusion protein
MTKNARRSWIVVSLVVALVAAALLVRARGHGLNGGGATAAAEAATREPAARGGGSQGAGAGGTGDRPTPVVVAHATTHDVPLYLDGLGSVTAYKTVNVRSQVDGRLEKVTFREGQAVKHGEMLAQIDPRPFTIMLHTAQAALARDQAQLHGAELNLTRYETVVTQKLIPQQQVDDQRALVEQLRAATQADNAQIENAKLQLDYAHIVSPIDGVTGVRLVDPGNLVHAADTNGIVVVTQMDPIAVLFTLPQDDLPSVSRYLADGALAVEAYSRDGAQLLATGQLGLVDNQINQTTATIRLKAIFPNPANPDRKLWPNQFVKARLRLTVRQGALVVPAVAVQRGPQGTFVYVVGDQRANIRPVTVDSIEGDQAIVSKGLEPGDTVVIEGQNQLRPGGRVAVREPNANPSSSPASPSGSAPSSPSAPHDRKKP